MDWRGAAIFFEYYGVGTWVVAEDGGVGVVVFALVLRMGSFGGLCFAGRRSQPLPPGPSNRTRVRTSASRYRIPASDTNLLYFNPASALPR